MKTGFLSILIGFIISIPIIYILKPLNQGAISFVILICIVIVALFIIFINKFREKKKES